MTYGATDDFGMRAVIGCTTMATILLMGLTNELLELTESTAESSTRSPCSEFTDKKIGDVE